MFKNYFTLLYDVTSGWKPRLREKKRGKKKIGNHFQKLFHVSHQWKPRLNNNLQPEQKKDKNQMECFY